MKTARNCARRTSPGPTRAKRGITSTKVLVLPKKTATGRSVKQQRWGRHLTKAGAAIKRSVVPKRNPCSRAAQQKARIFSLKRASKKQARGGSFGCCLCQKKYPNPSNLKLHLAAAHFRSEILAEVPAGSARCPRCGEDKGGDNKRPATVKFDLLRHLTGFHDTVLDAAPPAVRRHLVGLGGGPRHAGDASDSLVNFSRLCDHWPLPLQERHPGEAGRRREVPQVPDRPRRQARPGPDGAGEDQDCPAHGKLQPHAAGRGAEGRGEGADQHHQLAWEKTERHQMKTNYKPIILHLHRRR